MVGEGGAASSVSQEGHCCHPLLGTWAGQVAPSHPAVCPQLEDCTLQVSPSGHYLDLELSLLEQKDDLEAFYEEVR